MRFDDSFIDFDLSKQSSINMFGQKEDAVANASQAKQNSINDKVNQDTLDRFNETVIRNNRRDFGEHAQDAASLALRASLGLGQIAYGATDLALYGISLGNIDLDKATEDQYGESLSQKFQRSRRIANSFESEQLTARRAEIARRSHERGLTNQQFDATNPTGLDNFFQGVKNFGSAVADQIEFATVGLDSALESIPQALVPGGITNIFRAKLAGAAGKLAAKNVTRTKQGKALFNANVPEGKVAKNFRRTKAGKAITKEIKEIASRKGAKDYLESKAGVKAVNSIASKTGLTYVAVSEGISNAGEVQSTILNSTEKDLNASSKEYRELRKQGQTHKQAKRALANTGRLITALIAGATGAVAGKLTGSAKLEGLGFKVDSPVGKKIASKILVNPVTSSAAREGVEETLQGASGTFAGNVAQRLTSNDDQKLSEGVIEGAAQGLVAGVISGGGLAAVLNIPNVGSTVSTGIKTGVQAVSKKIEEKTLSNVDPIAKKAIKSGDLSNIDKEANPLAYLQAITNEKFIPKDEKELAKHNEELVRAATVIFNDLGTRGKALADIGDTVQEFQKQLISHEETPNLTDEQVTEYTQAIEQYITDLGEFRTLKDAYVIQNDKITTIKEGIKATAQAPIQAIKEKLDADNSTVIGENTNVDAPKDNSTKITVDEANTLLGSGTRVTESQVNQLAEIDGLSEESKAAIDYYKAVNSISAVSQNIADNAPLLTDKPNAKKGVVQHIEAILTATSKADKVGAYNEYVQFRDGLINKSKEILDLNKPKTSPEYKKAFAKYIPQKLKDKNPADLDAQVTKIMHSVSKALRQQDLPLLKVTDIHLSNFAGITTNSPLEGSTEVGSTPEQSVDNVTTPETTSVQNTDTGTADVPTKGKIQRIKRVSVNTPSKHKDSLFVFGDNLIGKGKAGQAVIRDAENSIGIPTKNLPSNKDGAFATDADFDTYKTAIDTAITSIKEAQDSGKNIVFPVDGLGTGLANLAESSPKIDNYLRAQLKSNFGYTYPTPQTSKGTVAKADKPKANVPDTVQNTQQQQQTTTTTPEESGTDTDIRVGYQSSIDELNGNEIHPDAPSTVNATIVRERFEELYNSKIPLSDKQLSKIMQIALNGEKFISNKTHKQNIMRAVNSLLVEFNPTFVNPNQQSDAPTKQVNTKVKEGTPYTKAKLKLLDKLTKDSNLDATQKAAVIKQLESGIDKLNPKSKTYLTDAVALLETNATRLAESQAQQGKLAIQLGLKAKTESYAENTNKATDFIDAPERKTKTQGTIEAITNVFTKWFTLRPSGNIFGSSFDLTNRLDFDKAILASLPPNTDLNDVQQQSIDNVFDYIGKYIKEYRKRQVTSSTINSKGNPLINGSFLATAPIYSMLRGEGVKVFDDNVVAAFAMASLDYITGSMLEDINPAEARTRTASILGIKDKRQPINNFHVKVLGNIGKLRSDLEKDIGRSFKSIIGVQANDETLESVSDLMDSTAGAIITQSMLNTGTLVETVMPTALYQAITDPTALNLETFTKYFDNVTGQYIKGSYEKDFADALQTISFLSANHRVDIKTTKAGNRYSTKQVHPRLDTMANMFTNTASLGHKLFGVTSVDKLPSLNEPTELQETAGGKKQNKVNPKVAKIRLEHSKKPVKLNKSITQVLLSLGREQVIDMIVTPLDEQVIHSDDFMSEKAKYDTTVRSINDFFDFVEGLPTQDAEFYLTQVGWTNTRTGLENNKLNPQGDKFARFIMQYSANKISITKGDSDSLLGFKLAVTQALGHSIDNMNINQINTVFNGLVDEANTPDSFLQQQIEVANGLSETNTPEDFGSGIVESLIIKDHKGNEGLHHLTGLLALGDYISTEEGDSFDTSIFYEVDGKTNGFAITLLQLVTQSGGVTSSNIGILEAKVIENSDPEAIATFYDSRGKRTSILQKLIRNLSVDERLAKTGVMQDSSTFKTYVEYKQKTGSQDSYQELMADILTREVNVNKVLGDQTKAELLDTMISAGITKAINSTIFRVNKAIKEGNLLSPETVHYMYTNALQNNIDSLVNLINKDLDGESQPQLGISEEQLNSIKDINNLRTAANILYSARADDSKRTAAMILNNATPGKPKYVVIKAEMARRGRNTAKHIRTANDRLDAAQSLVGALQKGESIDEQGLPQFIISSLGRELAKPALLISNYGAAITSIINKYSDFVIAELKKDLVNLHKTREDIDSQGRIDALNKAYNQLTGKTGVILFTKQNLLSRLPADISTVVRANLNKSYGQLIKDTLQEKYGDVFEARRQLTNMTSLTYHLYKAYEQATIEEYKKEHDITALTVGDRKTINEQLIAVTPYYETYFSESIDEGILGPVLSEKQVINDPSYTSNVPIITKEGAVGRRKVTGYRKEVDHPGVRVPVMLTHSLDATVQLLFIEKLHEQTGITALNLHDAYGMSTLNPELTTKIYNESYKEAVIKFSITESVNNPLQRIHEAFELMGDTGTYQDNYKKLEKDIKDRVVTDGGLGLLGMRGFLELGIPGLVASAGNISRETNQARNEYFSRGDIHFNQYIATDLEGSTSTVKEANANLDSNHTPSPKTETSNTETELGSSNEDLDISNFKADTEVDLTPSSVVAEFDNLVGAGNKQDTPSHTAQLKDVIESIIQKVLKPVTLKIRTAGNSTIGAYKPSEGIFLNISSPTAGKPNLFTDMSPQEVYTHELTHRVILEALNTIPALYTRADRFRTEVMQAKDANGNLIMTSDIFLDPALANNPDAVKLAEDTFNYIFHNTGTSRVNILDPRTGKKVSKKVENGIHEFMTFSVTNEPFIRALKQIQIANKVKVNTNATLFEKAVELFNTILNIFRRYTGKSNTSADIAAMNIVNALADVQVKQRSQVAKVYNQVTDTVSTIYSKSIDKTIGKLLKDGITIKGVNHNLNLPDVDTYDAFFTGAKAVLGKTSAPLDGFAHGILNELHPNSKTNDFIHNAFRYKRVKIDQATQRISHGFVTYVNNLFDNELNKQDKIHITKVMLRTDSQSLVGSYDANQLGDFMLKPSSLQTEINSLEKQLKKDFGANAHYYSVMSKNLAWFMATQKSRGKALLLNAYDIANLKQSGLKSIGNLKAAEKAIDTLTSLRALAFTESGVLRKAGVLYKKYPKQMDELLESNRINYLSRMKSMFNNNPSQVTKGWVREKYSNNIQIRVGERADLDQMASEGFYPDENAKSMLNDPSDKSPEKLLYVNKYADLSARVSGAFSLSDIHAKGTKVENKYLSDVILDKDRVFKKIANGGDVLTTSDEGNVIPLMNSSGDIVGYRYVISNFHKESMLDADLTIDNVMARMETHNITRTRTKIVNKALVDNAFKSFSTATPQSQRLQYVAIGAKEKGKFKEYWDLLPEETKQDVINTWGTARMYLPKDAVIMAMGQAKWSTQSIRKKDLTNLKGKKHVYGAINNVVATLLNNPKINFGETLLREAILFAKDTIVNRTGTVLVGNQLSNMITLKIKGIPFADILQGQTEAVKHIKLYAITTDKIMQNIIKLRNNPTLSKQERKVIKAELTRLNHQLTQNPVGPLIDAGMHQTIVEDVDITDDPSKMGRIEKAIKGNKLIQSLSNTSGNAYSNAIRKVGSELLMTHNSALYSFLHDATRISDFAARYVLHKHNLAKGIDANKSISEIDRTFINYDLPSHPFLQLGNDLGFMIFTKFLFRIQPIIAELLVNNPKNVTAFLLYQLTLGIDPEDIMEAFMSPTKLINKFNNPFELMLDVMDEGLVASTLT